MNKKPLELDETLVDIHPHANAFRIIDAEGSDCFLDFLHWCEAENRASVVSRVRVRSGFLPLIKYRLNLALKEIGDDIPIN